MRRGSRNLVPTILAAEAAIIGLLFVGHFTMPEGDTAPVELTLAEAPVSPFPPPATVEAVIPRPAPPETLAVSQEVDPAPTALAPASRALGALSPVSAARDTRPDLERLIQSVLWTPAPMTIEPLPLPDAPARPAARAAAAAPEPVTTPPATAAPDPVVPEPAFGSIPAPPHRPVPPPARVVAVSASASAPPLPPAARAASGTVSIEGRVFDCSTLSPALQARFASCGGAPESTVGTVEINGTTVTCDRLTAALRSRFPSCGS